MSPALPQPRWCLELLGAPGAGKSRLAADLARHPGVVVLKQHGLGDAPALAGGMLRSWRVALTGARRQSTPGRWVAWTGRLAAAPQVVRRRYAAGAEGVAWDQGPAYSWLRMSSALADADIVRLPDGDGPVAGWWPARRRELVGTLDLLVLVEADLPSLVERTRERAKAHPAQLLPDAALRRYLQGEVEACRRVADELERAGVAVLRLDTTLTPVVTLTAAVMRALRHRRAWS
ncbi:MAG TPA: AAA family ATPase [Nocardioidaceae bacterium]|nr:AAA family ATPase [Nocardioidaceae bacterium]